MNKNILVIGGTRFFGKLLVQRLVMAGNKVTIATRGYAPDPFGDRIERIRVDRRNEAAMRTAFRGARYDVVFDQMCYSPLDAAIAARTFAGKTGRYVVTSTIDVYRGLLGKQDAPFKEDDLNVQAQPIDTAYPWHDPARAIESYVPGKLQAEAYLYRDGTLPLVTVRLGHVIGGQGDFTGRLAHYVDLVRACAPLRYAHADATTSLTSPQEAARFLAWVGSQRFEGPVNGACAGALSAHALYHKTAQLLDAQPRAIRQHPGQAGELSPFDYPAPLALDTSRATALGYRFGHSDEWLDDAIRQYDLAFV
ncbi:NAD-dependent epimerase/dehydratase family protein [Massilia terrae]|uniref:NAD-dependent epimerase/dehydratase family protein n=1 Tax=Massilia terrae TaxID=1811224 RepID=A0ABT2CUD1_9BURK|nr:NAD-dependent epimerase/dehydratase family protein [Massilia terrae]MCS0657582.1 NAD-dependent epimerase/dehydratase family protein [Massilia terrae]